MRRLGMASLAVLYVGDRADQDFSTFERVTLPSYTRVDLAAEGFVRHPHAGTPGIAVRARLENVFNAKYEEARYYPARPRVLFLGAQVWFGD